MKCINKLEFRQIQSLTWRWPRTISFTDEQSPTKHYKTSQQTKIGKKQGLKKTKTQVKRNKLYAAELEKLRTKSPVGSDLKGFSLFLFLCCFQRLGLRQFGEEAKKQEGSHRE